MDLRSFREKMGWSIEEAASFAGFSNEAVWRRYESGTRFPQPEAIATIERLSGGQVTANDHHATRMAFLQKQKSAAKKSVGSGSQEPVNQPG